MDLKVYVLPLWKRWWLILGALVIATGSSYLALRDQPVLYQTRATLMVGQSINNPNPNGSDLSLTQQLASTYADLGQRTTVQNATMAALGLARLPQTSVATVGGTQLVEIKVTDTSPAQAAAVANELARQLVLLSPSGSDQSGQPRAAFVKQQLDEMEAAINDTKAAITKKQNDLLNLFSARQIADAQAQITSLQAKLTSLQANYAAMLQSTQNGATNALRVIEPAAVPTVPIPSHPMTTMLLAVAIGLVLGCFAVYLLEYLDDTLKNPDSVQRVLGLDTLGAIPVGQGSPADATVMVGEDYRFTEAYNVLRTNLQFATLGKPLRSLLVTSANVGEGKSSTAANLAVAAAQAGQRVVLVDADLRRPVQHHIFGPLREVGLTTALCHEQPDLDDLLQPANVPGLRLLVAGSPPSNPATMLGSVPMRHLIEALEELADLVIFDTPIASAFADAAVLSTQVDGVLFVIDAGHTRKVHAERALNGLKRVDAPIIGVLLNRMPQRGGDFYYYYHYDYNHYLPPLAAEPELVPEPLPVPEPVPAPEAAGPGASSSNGSGREQQRQVTRGTPRRSQGNPNGGVRGQARNRKG